MLGNTGTLFASLVWGTIGCGFAIYGKKQRAGFAFGGGMALMAISYVIGSPLYMSLVGTGLVVATIYLSKRFD